MFNFSLFAPINFSNILILFFLLLVFEATGSIIAYRIKVPLYLRLTNWVWGFSIFTFLWFLLHFFIPFWPAYVWISIGLMAIVSLPFYFKKKVYRSLFTSIKVFPYPFLILIIGAKPLYFLLSAPPYYGDELTYQFYSPARITIETIWPFLLGLKDDPPSLYEMLPKSLNIGYWTTFSLSKSYVIGRLLHFLIVFTAIGSIGLYLKEKTRTTVGVLFVVFALYLSSIFLLSSTLGYVDAAAAIYSILFLITLVDLFINKSKKSLLVCAVVLGIAVSFKYTNIIFITSLIVSAIVLMTTEQRQTILKQSKKKANVFKFFKKYWKVLLVSICLVNLFGGYWYIKNIIISGNPIFPMFFPCLHGWTCGRGGEFFAGWALPFDLQHFEGIKMVLFQNSNAYFYVTIISLISSLLVSYIKKIKVIFYISLLSLSAVVLEIFISRNSTGFELRYYYHWILLIALSLVLPIALVTYKSNKIWSKRVIFVFISMFLLYIPVTGMLVKNIKRIYEGDYVPGYVRNYAMGRINLGEWYDYYFPEMSGFINWCSNGTQMKDVLVIDPNLIWLSTEGWMRVFMVNCNLIFPIVDETKSVQINYMVNKTKFSGHYLVSLEECLSKKRETYPTKEALKRKMMDLNQKMICGAKKIDPNLYTIPKSK